MTRPNINRWAANRGQVLRYRQVTAPPSRDLIDVAQELGRELGNEGYYNWSSALPREIIMNNERYKEAIESKLEEIRAIECIDNGVNKCLCNLCNPGYPCEADQDLLF